MQQNMEKSKSLWSELHDHKKQIHPMHLGVFNHCILLKYKSSTFFKWKSHLVNQPKQFKTALNKYATLDNKTSLKCQFF